jgi:hypothetical protein
VDVHDVERIARATLRELGVPRAELKIVPIQGQPGGFRIDIAAGGSSPRTLKIKCGTGSTPQWVREQIFNQYTS